MADYRSRLGHRIDLDTAPWVTSMPVRGERAIGYKRHLRTALQLALGPASA